jgi:hypothetical protein
VPGDGRQLLKANVTLIEGAEHRTSRLRCTNASSAIAKTLSSMFCERKLAHVA